MQKSSDLSYARESRATVPLKQSVLIVDDGDDILLLHKILLEMEGFDVFTAQSGEEALAILFKIDEPNLILLDMQMADMTGTEFLTLLQEKIPRIIEDVPVVFVTGLDRVPESKAVGFIRKPADREAFIKAVHRFIEMGSHAPFKH
jgi:CheY-like chemotaxis protein